jgi:hypothetical protein
MAESRLVLGRTKLAGRMVTPQYLFGLLQVSSAVVILGSSSDATVLPTPPAESVEVQDPFGLYSANSVPEGDHCAAPVPAVPAVEVTTMHEQGAEAVSRVASVAEVAGDDSAMLTPTLQEQQADPASAVETIAEAGAMQTQTASETVSGLEVLRLTPGGWLAAGTHDNDSDSPTWRLPSDDTTVYTSGSYDDTTVYTEDEQIHHAQAASSAQPVPEPVQQVPPTKAPPPPPPGWPGTRYHHHHLVFRNHHTQLPMSDDVPRHPRLKLPLSHGCQYRCTWFPT